MAQYEQVIKTMEQNNGFTTLGFLYQNVDVSKWGTKTPFASIRRIVQDKRFFFKIKPGLWALRSYKDKLPFDILPSKEVSRSAQEALDHTYYQGLLIDIGNIKKFKTFVPYQDKNKKYLGRKLRDIISIEKFYEFGYQHVVNRALTIDVSWFNQREMPSAFFEVEYSTNIHNSLLKFVDLQDFNVRFFIVADEVREREFKKKMRYNAFFCVKTRVQFMDYEKLSEWHAKSFEIANLEKDINFTYGNKD